MRRGSGSGGRGAGGRRGDRTVMVLTWKTEAEDLEFMVILGYMVISRQT